jgi:hypothetical protein
MDDKLFEPTASDSDPKPPEGEGKPDEGAKPQGDSDIASLKADVAATNQAVSDLTNTLKGLVEASKAQPAAVEPADDPEPPDPSDALNQLASDPQGYIEKAAKGVFDKGVGADVAPVARTLLETQHRAFMAQHKVEVDNTYGSGTWDEVLMPIMAPKVEQIKANNLVLLGRAETTDMLVAEAKGRNMDVLATRKATAAEAAKEAILKERIEIASTLPPSGVRSRPSAEGELTADAKLMLHEIEAKTGIKADPKTFAKLHGTGNTLSDYIAATGGSK